MALLAVALKSGNDCWIDRIKVVIIKEGKRRQHAFTVEMFKTCLYFLQVIQIQRECSWPDNFKIFDELLLRFQWNIFKASWLNPHLRHLHLASFLWFSEWLRYFYICINTDKYAYSTSWTNKNKFLLSYLPCMVKLYE